jgi:hypothetical protein
MPLKMITSHLGRLPSTTDRPYIRFISIAELLLSGHADGSRLLRTVRQGNPVDLPIAHHYAGEQP